MVKTELMIPCMGYELAADWYEMETERTVLVLPGYQSTKERQEDLVTKVAIQSNMNALVLDYSGHGRSPLPLDETRPAQHILEAITTFDWLKQEKPGHEVMIIGTSYGGYLAAHLAQYRQFSRLLLRTPALYTPRDLYSLAPNIDREYTSKVYRQDAKELKQHPLFKQERVFSGKTLVVVHGEDSDVPVPTTDAYIDAFAAEPYVAEGFRHSSHDKDNPEKGYADYYGFMARWLLKD